MTVSVAGGVACPRFPQSRATALRRWWWSPCALLIEAGARVDPVRPVHEGPDLEVAIMTRRRVARALGLSILCMLGLALGSPPVEGQNCYICSGSQGSSVCLNNFSFTGWTQCMGHGGWCFVYGDYVENCQGWASRDWFNEADGPGDHEAIEWLLAWSPASQRVDRPLMVRLQRRTCSGAIWNLERVRSEEPDPVDLQLDRPQPLRAEPSQRALPLPTLRDGPRRR